MNLGKIIPVVQIISRVLNIIVGKGNSKVPKHPSKWEPLRFRITVEDGKAWVVPVSNDIEFYHHSVNDDSDEVSYFDLRSQLEIKFDIQSLPARN